MNTMAGSVKILLDFLAGKTSDLTTISSALRKSPTTIRTFTFGAAASMVNSYWSDTRPLAAEATETHDFNGGGLLDDFGDAIALVRAKVLWIKNNDTATNLEVGGGASADMLFLKATSDIIVIPPGGEFLWVCSTAAGLVMEAGASDKLKIARAAGVVTDNTYSIFIAGCTS